MYLFNRLKREAQKKHIERSVDARKGVSQMSYVTHTANIHIQIPPTGYVGLILRSTPVASKVAVPLRVL